MTKGFTLPIIDDFNGDGRDELIIEIGQEINFENGEPGWKQSFVYTDGIKTFQFQNLENEKLYETNIYKIPVDNGCHLAVNSKWRDTELNNIVYYASIYSFDGENEKRLFEESSCRFSNPRKNRIDIRLYDIYTDNIDEEDMCRISLFWRDSKYNYFGLYDGISSDYSDASIMPRKDPVSEWKGTDVKEVVGSYGIHLYFPSFWFESRNVTASYFGDGGSLYFDNNYSDFLVETICLHDEFMYEQMKELNNPYVYELGEMYNGHIIITLPHYNTEVDYNDPDNYLTDYEKYRDIIADTAWVE